MVYGCEMRSSFPPEERHQLEEELLQQLRAAEQGYRLAASDHKKVIEAARAKGWKVDLDGEQALRVAGAAERDAMERYAKALRAFTDLIVRGKGTDHEGES
jgi:hypothetical protein